MAYQAATRRMASSVLRTRIAGVAPFAAPKPRFQVAQVAPRFQIAMRPYSSEASSEASSAAPAASPPLLQKIRTDLKTAMRAKDATRLAVIRSIIAGVDNASKGPWPVKTDAALVAHLRKAARACEDAAKEFKEAKRDDLADKENANVAILEEYIADGAASTGELSAEETRKVVEELWKDLKSQGKANINRAMKELFNGSGSLKHKNVNRPVAIETIKQLSSSAENKAKNAKPSKPLDEETKDQIKAGWAQLEIEGKATMGSAMGMLFGKDGILKPGKGGTGDAVALVRQLVDSKKQ